MTKKDQIIIDKTEKMLIGMLLIAENYESVINSNMISSTNKYKLKNLANQCERFQDKFWSYLDENAEKEFQNKVKKIENLLL